MKTKLLLIITLFLFSKSYSQKGTGKPVSEADKKKMEAEEKAKMDSLFNAASQSVAMSMDSLTQEDKLSEQAKTYFTKYSTGKLFTDACKKSLPTVDDCKLVFKGQNAYTYYGFVEDMKSKMNAEDKSEMDKYVATKIDIFTTSDIAHKSKGNYAGYMQNIVDKLQPNITFYGVNKFKKTTDEYGMNYKYWIKLGERWVFFPSMADAFKK